MRFKTYDVKFIFGKEVEKIRCNTLDRVDQTCKMVINGNGRLGIEWTDIDTDILVKNGYVDVDAWTKVRLDTHYRI